MHYPRRFAHETPQRAAAIMAGSGLSRSFGELEGRANQIAHLLRQSGLRTGDAIAVCMENRLEFFDIYWGAQRAGLILTPIATHLTPVEAAYVINDCAARLVLVSSGASPSMRALFEKRDELAPAVESWISVGAPIGGARELEQSISGLPKQKIADEAPGYHMVYSSGTTGRPKGVRPRLSLERVEDPPPFMATVRDVHGVNPSTFYLSPAPLYHAAPISFCLSVQRLGGTAVVMEKFEPLAMLEAIERWKITFMQAVPTMFIRLLKLTAVERARFDLSSLQRVVHAAAPCPVPVKRAMIEWLGPIIYEYYGGSEANGSTFISPEEWLRKPGSVGRPLNGLTVHICGEDFREVEREQTGSVFFEGGSEFTYHNDPEKTLSARHPVHPTWSTLGDIGYLDEDGYLFLTDRKAFMIISGGVNIYPQEAENVLVLHPLVADAAVFGIPHPEFGEEVKAAVELTGGTAPSEMLAAELLQFCRERLSPLKCPRSIDFESNLPREATGKLYKKALRDRYWGKA